MKDLIRRWLRMLLGGGAIATLLLLAVGSASAQYGGYSSPGYCQPGYCPPTSYGYGHAPAYYRNVWSAWTYGPWGKDPSYFIYYRTWYDHCGAATNHNDGWLYNRHSQGGKWCYERHCLISAYASKPSLDPSPYVEKYNGTQAGYDADLYAVVKKYPFLFGGVLAQKDLPYASSPQDFLAPLNSTAELRQTLAHKSEMSSKDIALKIFQQESEAESRDKEVRGRLAIISEHGRQDERMFAEFKEFLAVRRQQVTIDANAGQAVKVPVADPELATLITNNCLRCHGAEKQEGGLDFRQADKFTSDQRYAVFSATLTGEMPKGGTALTRDQTEPFRKWYEEALLAARR